MSADKIKLVEGRGLTLAGFALFLGVVILVVYGDIALGFRTLFYRDFGIFGYPIAYHHHVSFWQGEVPLWNPYSGCGMPFLAQWNTMVLYPGSLIYLLLPLPWGVNLFMVLHLAWAGLGMYWLAWKWAGDRLGACIAGLGFAFGGLLTNSMMWPNNMAAFAWMPWVVLVVEMACCRGGQWIIHAAVLGGMQMLTGAPEVILLTWVVVGVLWLFGGGFSSCSRGLRGWLRLLSVIAIVVMLSAAQLLPFLELLLQHSHRASAFDRPDWSMATGAWGNFLIPQYRTLVSPLGIAFHRDQFWTNSFYPGIGVVLLAICALWRVRSRRVLVLLSLAFFGFWLATGPRGGLLPLLERALPPLEFIRFPIKYIILTTFALPLLAAYGVHGLHTTGMTLSKRALGIGILVGVFLLLILGLVFVAHSSPGVGEDWHRSLRSGGSRFLLLVIFAGGLMLADTSWRRRIPAVAGTLILLGVLAFDLGSHQPNQNPTAENRILAPFFADLPDMKPIPRLGESRAMTEVGAGSRVWQKDISNLENDFLILRLALLGNVNLIERIPIVHGFFSLELRDSLALRAIAEQQLASGEEEILDLLGVSQITRPGADFEWMHRSSAAPLMTFPSVRPAESQEDVLRILSEPGYQAGRYTCLITDAPIAEPGNSDAEAQLLRSSWTGGGVTIRAAVRRAGLLRIAQAYYPHWRATIDGEAVAVAKTDLALQAVELSAGEHDLELVFWDRAFLVGLLLAWIGVGIGIVGANNKARTMSGPESFKQAVVIV
ncbi:MAG: hypothetical protein RI897_373 [Verrucomicrobiota bacterium]|jgi:hypothetical protein